MVISNSKQIGLRQLITLANMKQAEQIEVIAAGLGVLFNSAEKMKVAAQTLREHPRSAAVLEGQADEELAKLLILVDFIRCPEKKRASVLKKTVGSFYSHFARLLYVAAQEWRPTDVADLQSILNQHRKSHTLEGSVGEYIVPNTEVYRREAVLYADLERHDDGSLEWTDPEERPTFSMVSPASLFGFESGIWRICKALKRIGVFEEKGLRLFAKPWSKMYFSGTQSWCDSERLLSEAIETLDGAGLVDSDFNDSDLRALVETWQVPMYALEFNEVIVNFEELLARQERSLANEMGC